MISFSEKCERADQADIVVVGLPFDGTVSFRPGSRFAPGAVREVWQAIETYSPSLDRDIRDYKIFDAGDLELPPGNRDRALDIIRSETESFLSKNKKIVFLGGEHLVTLPVIESFYRKFGGLTLIHLDAHTDLRDSYMGEKLSHATVILRVGEIIGLENIFTCGIRSGLREEFELKRPLAPSRLKEVISGTSGPMYLTLDLDVLDPSIFPGTGTPEPGGLSFNELMDVLYAFRGKKNLIGADLVELCPPYDPQGNSSIVAAKILREILLMMAE